jgi:hypothetical protein
MHRLIPLVDARLQIGDPRFLVLDSRSPLLPGTLPAHQSLIGAQL